MNVSIKFFFGKFTMFETVLLRNSKLKSAIGKSFSTYQWEIHDCYIKYSKYM